jgi:hypothetical protein
MVNRTGLHKVVEPVTELGTNYTRNGDEELTIAFAITKAKLPGRRLFISRQLLDIIQTYK